jgi:hypothetical protein
MKMQAWALIGAAASLMTATVAAHGEAKPDPARLRATVEKLVSFGTRHTLSSPDHPTRGIGAARRWAKAEFEAIAAQCGDCLKVEMLERQMSGPRAPDGVNIVDVIAVRPGKMGWNHVIIIAGHIDSRVSDIMNATSDAPGANDDGSGSALVLEAARIMAKMPQGEATIVFALLSGEEQGLMGGRLLAETAKERGWKVSAMLNNDIVGGTKGTDGRIVKNVVRVFSEGIRASEDLPAQMARRGSGGENDGPSRALMHRADSIASQQTKIGLDVFGVLRPDRFSRGGDHLPALDLGFPAIRFTVGVENYNHQHQDVRVEKGIEFGDSVDKMDFAYLSKVTALNIAVARSIANALPAPETATLSGAVSSDSVVNWTPVVGASGYRVYWRRADSLAWQGVVDIADAKATQFIFKGKIVDDTFFGVSSLGADDSESIITFAGLPPRP